MDGLASQLDSLGASGALNAQSVLQADASKFGNDSGVEFLWAEKAHKHAEVYMKLISSFDPKNLKLTKFDDVIYRNFKRFFKKINIEILNEDDFKTEESKARWRPYCEQFKGKVDDYNFATLVRIDCKKEYTEENSMLVTRIQFYAIELARNKRSLNNFHTQNKNESETKESMVDTTTTIKDENHNNEDISHQMNSINTKNDSQR